MAKRSRPRRPSRRPGVESLEMRRLLTVFPVTSNGDDANTVGTLRWAVTQSNATGPGPNSITFNLPAGQTTIQPASLLPTITRAVTIDATTEPNYAGAPLVTLDGTAAGAGVNGFNVGAAGVTIKGLAIGNFRGAGVELLAPGGDTIASSFIGTDRTGKAAAPNGVAGVLISSSPNNTVGGSSAQLNLISGNAGPGVQISGAASRGNVVSFDSIGVDATGKAALANTLGVANQLGVSNLISNVLVSGNTNGGLLFQSGSGNVIQAANVGLDFFGTTGVPNGQFGIELENESNDAVGSAGFANLNFVSKNGGAGVIVNGGAGNRVSNSFIGLNKAGNAALGNAADGVLVENAAVNTTVGGTTGTLGNFIAGNANNGVDVQTLSTGTLIKFNFIGSDVGGVIGIPNGQNGVQFQQTSGRVDTDSILDNGQSGVLLFGGSGSTVVNSSIGDVPTGTHGNALNGVFVFGSNNNTIGGLGAGNVISGNADYGVTIEAGSQNNLVLANYVGLSRTGLGNRGNMNGIAVFDSSGTTIGGTSAAAGNIIGGNTQYGVDVHGTDSPGTLVLGNIIGIAATGLVTAPNASGIILDATSGVVVQQNIVSGNVVDGIFVNGGSGSLIKSNLIGTNTAGTGAMGNGADGVDIVGANHITVGGPTNASTNIIGANAGYGVQVSGAGASANTITGDFIGFGLGGSTPLGNGQSGISVENVPGTMIGGSPTAYNLIGNNALEGISVSGAAASGTQIVNNIVGLAGNGSTVAANGVDGILVNQSATGVNIAFNFISGNTNYGVHLANNANNAFIGGNLIGTDLFGAKARGNGLAGVLIEGTSGNVIGAASARNVISGNKGDGIFIFGATATGNTVQGNFIGTNANGNAALGNAIDGVLVQGPSNTVGGTAAGARNLISGNGFTGIHFTGGGTGNTVAGNWIGLNLAGNGAIGNSFYGVFVDGSGSASAARNTIGGSAAGKNLVVGSGSVNINVNGAGSTGTLIAGNLIGTDATGVVGLFPTPTGIALNSSPGNIVGGTTAGLGNTISGQASTGISILNAGASGNRVIGNLIGRTITGNVTLGNNVGVLINNAPNNTVGGTTAGAGNTITGNTTNTIQVTGSGATGNQTTGNTIGPF